MTDDVTNRAFNRMVMTRLLREDPCNTGLWKRLSDGESRGRADCAAEERVDALQ